MDKVILKAHIENNGGTAKYKLQELKLLIKC